jgi:hypothetical protein
LILLLQPQREEELRVAEAMMVAERMEEVETNRILSRNLNPNRTQDL